MPASVGVNVDGGVVLLEGRGVAVHGVQTRWVGGVTVTGLEDVVGVVTWHDEVAAHLVECVLADKRGWRRVGTSNADSEADLAVGDVVHPLLVKDVLTGDVGGDVTTDWVTHVGSSVRVELTTVVTVDHVDLGEITVGHDLNVQRSLDEVDTSHGTVGDDSGVVSRLCAVRDSLSLDIADSLPDVGAECAPVVNGVDGRKTCDGGCGEEQGWETIERVSVIAHFITKQSVAKSGLLTLVDGSVQRRLVRVGGAVLVGADDTLGVGVRFAVPELGHVLGRRDGAGLLSACLGSEQGANKGQGGSSGSNHVG